MRIREQIFILLVAMLAVRECRAETSQTAASAAGPRGVSHLLYDSARRQMVILAAPRGSEWEQLWALDGSTWKEIPVRGPAARELGAAASDTRRKQIIMHGGMASHDRETRFGDTWLWDGKSWRESADDAIGKRDHHAMAFDEARGKVVLFGGVKPDDQLARDTWEWDGERWQQAAKEGMEGGAHCSLAFDAKRGITVLFGGLTEGYRVAGDTWGWNGSSWKLLAAEGPPPRSHHRMAYDAKAGAMVLFGGLKSGKPTQALGDTWAFDGSSWKESKTDGPAARSGHMMAYDPDYKRIILYGGGSYDGKTATNYADTWEWKEGRWRKLGGP